MDLDAFYVACEKRDRPDLEGRPVIVGPPPAAGPTRGVVLSASYEARRFGVRSAMPAAAAARLCPDAVWVAPSFEKYGRASEEVRTVLRRYSEEVIPFSIDEAAVIVDRPTPEAARDVAASIQQALKEELRLPASLGVSPSRVVAKIATDRAKPGGIVVVAPGEVASFLAPMPVRAVPGVGPKTGERLEAHGVRTIGDLAGQHPSEISRWLGGFGRELVALARGHPEESPLTDLGPRSRSTDHTFLEDVDRWEEIEAAVRRLAESLAESLAQEGLRFGAVGVGFRWQDFNRTQRVRSLTGAQEGPESLAEHARRLAQELWEAEIAGAHRAVRTVSVRAERLVERVQRQARLDDFSKGAVGRS